MVIEQLELAVLDGEIFLEALCELFLVDEVADADADAVVAVDIARADAVVRRTDFALAARIIGELIHQAVIRQDELGTVADADAREVDAASARLSISCSMTFGLKATPLPMTQCEPLKRIPDGIRRSL